MATPTGAHINNSNMTFIELNLHQKTDSKAQQPSGGLGVIKYYVFNVILILYKNVRNYS